MPNLWTHLLFGQQVLKEMNQEQLISEPSLHQLFNLGCQGPDFLLYHNFLPWTKEKRVAKLGEVMHNEHCGIFLIKMSEYLHEYKEDKQLVIYSLGFISHYVLDRHLHPFIYFFSGYEEWQHQRFEVMMDAQIVQKLTGQETWQTPSWKQIYLEQNLPESIVTMFMEITKEIYPKESQGIHREDWHKAYQHLIWAHRLFHDPYGVKRILTLNKIEPLVYKRKVPDVDILNEAKSPWHHPTNEEEVYTYSAWDLWTQALANTTEIYELILPSLAAKNHISIKEFSKILSKIIGNYSYDSGKPCGTGAQLTYAEPII